jgi:hypothetical protein
VKGRPPWLPRRSSDTEGATRKGAAPSSGVNQTADIGGSAHIVGSGSQYNVNLTLGDESIRRLLPDLEQLLADLSDALAIIHEAAGAAQVPPDLDVAGLLRWLAELMIPADQLPRPLWVSELAGQRATDPAAQQAFSAIGERWADEVPGGQRRLNEFRKSHESADVPADEPCLVIILEPDSNGGERYRLSSILFRNTRDREPQHWDDTCLTLDEIQSRLQESLPALVQRVDRSSLFVEFVVPRELLNADFDQWPIPEPHGSFSHQYHQLGVRYPVVVRHLDRMTPSDDRSLWQARWQRLCSCAGPVNDAVRWVDPQGRESVGSLAAGLLRESADGQVCLALLPAHPVGTPIAELLGAGLTAGVPAAIWLRQPSTGRGGWKKDKRYLALAIEAAELHGLPRRVLDLRQKAEEAQEAATHQGRHLSLLWDDPPHP